MDVQVVASVAAGQQQVPLPVETGGGQPKAQPAQPSSQPAVLSPVVAKIFGQNGSASPQPVTVNVSYRVVHNPDMIVTVFSDPKTGQEIAQVPAEVLIQIAQFFDKEHGVTLDRSA